MAVTETNEKRFEQDIESYLLSDGGYVKGNQTFYDKSRAIDLTQLLAFIRNTQSKAWDRYSKIYGASAENQLYKRFQDEVVSKGLVHVLRNGIKDRGVDLKICYFEPASTINDVLVEKYNSNILSCTRQFRYSTENNNSIDMVLSLNGIPIVAIELKNQLTGQNVEHAKIQFMKDRNPKEILFQFNRRCLVCFACDHYDVWMTTELKGENTFFLPFNQGSNGAGQIGGSGNPPRDDYAIAYLWENVLQKDKLMAILQKYINVQIEEKTKIENGRKTTFKSAPKLIFPRYHQLDVVEKLVDSVKSIGSGKNYLIQHSAGSGKSNSIAWLTYRLAQLHNKLEEDVFQTVFVVTDRRVLNRQLQNTVTGFDHKIGQIVTITDKDNSTVLKEAIDDGKRIIITTLHRFPIIYQAVDAQKGKRFAIIVDEAHSSQTGNSAKKLKATLADTSIGVSEYADMNDVSENDVDTLDVITRELLSQGMHDNLSFFAFTATPKPKTLEMFGEPLPNGEYDSFHHYSMRQAISEGFILDVLKYYNTMESTCKIVKTVNDNPEYEEVPAVKAIRKYQKNHTDVMQQKVEIMVEQFRQVTLNKIGGKAKAMIVSPSRFHAVKYYHMINDYVLKKGYNDVKPLIAFSGTITVDGVEYTETQMNSTADLKISEAQLPDYFASDSFNLLLVADKYQTGFDEPKLHTMFVDKGLSGVKAVQTLSRLNRTCSGKNDTYVLDFVNNVDDIQTAFNTFYEDTKLEKALDVNIVYNYYDNMISYNVFNTEDVDKFVELYRKKNNQNNKDLGKISSHVQNAVNRYNDLNEEHRFAFRDCLKNFLRFYAYITQIVRMFDKDLHKTYLFCEFLFRLIPVNPSEPVKLEDKITLYNSKLTETFSGSIELDETSKDRILPPENPKKGAKKLDKKELLDNIIAKINLQSNLELSGVEMHIIEVIFDKMYFNNKALKKHAKMSDSDMFEKSIFPEEFDKTAQDCYSQQIDGYVKLFENTEFYKTIKNEMAKAMYLSLRSKK